MEESPRDHHSIDTLVSYSRGFLAGGEGGLLRVFEYADADDSTRFHCVKSLRLSGKADKDGARGGGGGMVARFSLSVVLSIKFAPSSPLTLLAAPGLECEDRIRTIAISPSEETAAVAVSGVALFSFDLAHANVKDETNAFTPLGPASHAPATGKGECAQCRTEMGEGAEEGGGASTILPPHLHMRCSRRLRAGLPVQHVRGAQHGRRHAQATAGHRECRGVDAWCGCRACDVFNTNHVFTTAHTHCHVRRSARTTPCACGTTSSARAR